MSHRKFPIPPRPRQLTPTKIVPVDPVHVEALRKMFMNVVKKRKEEEGRAKTRFSRHNFTA